MTKKRKYIRKAKAYNPEMGQNQKPIPKPEWQMIERLRERVKKLEGYIINEAILKQQERLDEKK